MSSLHQLAAPARTPTRALRPGARRPFTPQPPGGPYQLPRDIAERLTTALSGFKNREAAYALAVFLARFWSSRARMSKPFPVDRRELADREDLGLTEARIRGALGTLEAVGFLNRGTPPAGSTYRMTADGLHRKAVTFGFGAEYGPSFAAANARASRARSREERRKPQISSPKDTGGISRREVIMGEVARGCRVQRVAPRAEPHPALEAALQRLGLAAGFGVGEISDGSGERQCRR